VEIEGFSQRFSVIPPPAARQFRVEFAKARATKRRAARKLSPLLKERATALSSAWVEANPYRSAASSLGASGSHHICSTSAAALIPKLRRAYVLGSKRSWLES
jgi:hypothetical protein